MRKSLGSKRNVMDDEDIATITRAFGAFEVIEVRKLNKPAEQKSNRGRQSANPKTAAPKTFSSKIFATHEFGYRRLSIERPLRESYQFSDERIAELRFAPKPLNAVMKWVYEHFGQQWTEASDNKAPVANKAPAANKEYGELSDHQAAIRQHIKSHFSELKEKHIKDLLNRKTWLAHRTTLLKAKQLQQAEPHGMGREQHDDMNGFEAALKAACKAQAITLDTKEKKQITAAVSWKNPDAEKIIKKIHKNAKPSPIYGLFEVVGPTGEKRIVEYKSDGDLRDNENVALDPSRPVNETNEAYFAKEVQPHVSDAWIDSSKKDAIDGEIGIVGYEIPFNRHFYIHQPPRALAEIDAELDKVSGEIMALLQEVHS